VLTGGDRGERIERRGRRRVPRFPCDQEDATPTRWNAGGQNRSFTARVGSHRDPLTRMSEMEAAAGDRIRSAWETGVAEGTTNEEAAGVE
jgi:hypothetical protein